MSVSRNFTHTVLITDKNTHALIYVRMYENMERALKDISQNKDIQLIRRLKDIAISVESIAADGFLELEQEV